MMKYHIKFIIKSILFVVITGICAGMINECLKPKYYFNQDWPATNTFEDFYKLEKNSVDVLFLGSSHVISSLNPQVIYDNFGVVSYTLGSEQQSPVISYYWLREALKYQSPRIVVMDTAILHTYYDAYVYNDMNCSEGAVRKAMDNMRFSPLKWEAAKVIEKIDPTQSALSFPFMNIRYHTRWIDLDENDFTADSMIDHGGVKGFTALGGPNSDAFYIPFSDADIEPVIAEDMVETSVEYLDKIVELCEKENIQFILISTPCFEPIARYKSTKMYADAHGIPFYDFNEEKLYTEINYNAAENWLDHPNYLGAEKISLYIGNMLKNEYDIPSRVDPSYDQSRKLYEHKIENIKLQMTADISQYLDMLNNENYSVFIFATVLYSTYMNGEIMEKLNALGFTTNLIGVPNGTFYCAVKDGSNIIEKLTTDDVKFSGTVRDGLAQYEFNIDTSFMSTHNQTFSMIIAGAQCGNYNPGLNFVVYDNDLKQIIDKVNFNTNQADIPAKRY